MFNQNKPVTAKLSVWLDFTTHETSAGSEYAILHGVKIGYMDAVDYPLNDPYERQKFEDMVTERYGLDCYESEAEAEADLVNWHEDYMEAVA